jgi:uncharacterized protein
MDAETLIREFLDVTTMGPYDKWSERVSKDVVFRFPYAPEGINAELHGYEAATEAFRKVWDSFEAFAWCDVEISKIEGQDFFLTTARSEALRSSGKKYGNTYVMLTRLQDGLVVEHIEYFNPLAVAGH